LGDCAAPGRLYTTYRYVLHLDLYGQWEPVLLLDVSTSQGPELQKSLAWTRPRHAAFVPIQLTANTGRMATSYIEKKIRKED
jgi:hypothetical protein